ncbi:MAG: SCO family protein [Bryobacterales bacterium]|nr:SCO family protein [Bryobacterales bacterium]
MKRAILIFAAAMLAGCGSRPEPLPVYGQVPEFELTAETGEPFSSRTLAGKPWVADFIFTSCSGPCPRMSYLMSQIQRSVPGARLVSFTVDPEGDTPPVLASYARRYRAEPGRWTFLTGDRELLHKLSRDAFKLGNVDGSMEHSTRFVLVDGQGRIRGYYGTEEKSPLAEIQRDLERLERDPS